MRLKKKSALMLASTLGLSTLALARQKNGKPAARLSPSKCTGEVTAVRSSPNELTVRTAENPSLAEKTFVVEASTPIRVQGRSVHLADLKPARR